MRILARGPEPRFMHESFLRKFVYPAIFYGGPISSTWDLSKKLGEKNVEVYVSTTNANGNKRLKDIDTKEHIQQSENVFVRYYHEQIINIFSFSFFFGIFSDIKKSDVVYIQYLFHYTVLFSLFLSVFLGKKIILCPRGSFSSFTLSNKRIWLKRLWLFLFYQHQLRNYQSIHSKDELRWEYDFFQNSLDHGYPINKYLLRSSLLYL